MVELSKAKRDSTTSGPLAGLRVVEFAGIGPVPFAGMLFSDMGAEVIRIARPGSIPIAGDITSRGRHTINVDLKDQRNVEQVADLCDRADVLLEGFRPGVLERLGLGPDILLERNPRIIYGRMTGWGQTGPLASSAGHDINYISISGALAAFGASDERPIPPLNLVGDYGGGALYLVVGVLAALYETRSSGRGQIVDAAMSDGAASLMSIFYSLYSQGKWTLQRESNLIDGAAPFYNTYACSDGKYISVGPLEPQFYRLLLERLGLDPYEAENQSDVSNWKNKRAQLQGVFKSRSRDAWCSLLEGTDVCFAPVMTLAEAPFHFHNIARSTFLEVDGVMQPAPAPRFSRTPSSIQFGPSSSDATMQDWLVNWYKTG